LLSIRQHLMTGQGREELKMVLSVRGPTLLAFLGMIYQYANVDKVCLLPILIIINMLAFSNTVHEFRFFLPSC